MEQIKQFLLDNDYEFYELENLVEWNSKFLRCMVIKNKDGYLIRNAIKCYFDRWANSGFEFTVNTEQDVVSYFSDDTKCVSEAIRELTDVIIEDDFFNKDDKRTEKMIDLIYELIEEGEKK